MPDITLVAQRLSLEVAGLSAGELLADTISIRYVESLTRDGTLEALLTNWGGSSLGYKYSEGNVLRIGAQVTLSCGDVVLATGTINALAPHFNMDTVPTLAFTAMVRRPVANGSGPAVALQYGANLLEFHPVLQSTGNVRRQSIAATGVASVLPTLRAGVRATITGLGAHWSGAYSVTETTHSFDAQQGYRIAFACSR
jgi:hypothetical protein